MHVTAAATAANLAQQRLFAERIEATLGGVAGRSIALLGLAFKAGTDDIRFSPAVELARWLVARGGRTRRPIEDRKETRGLHGRERRPGARAR